MAAKKAKSRKTTAKKKGAAGGGAGARQVQWGYTLSSEEHAPGALVEAAVRAEEAAFDFCTISDHYHPWVQAQGHSGFVWGVLGAIGAATSRIQVGTGVTCPTVRIHPAVVAHAAATASLLLEGRFFLGVGSGEALNEHILGDRWPTPETRLDMLEESVEVMRALWTGETVDHSGVHYVVENARLFDPPAEEVPVIVSGFGTTAAALAGRIGDGLWGHGSDDALVEAFTSNGGDGPRFAQLNVCLGDDEAECRATVHRIWPNGGIPGQMAQDAPTWTHFEQIAELVTEDDACKDVSCGPDLDSVLETATEMVGAGFDRIHLHQIGPDQGALVKAWEGELGARLRALG